MTIIEYILLGKYFYIFIGAFFEGPIVMALAGFLVKTGHFNFWPAYGLLVAGDFTADVFWYYFGYLGSHRVIIRLGKYVGFNDKVYKKVRALFDKHDTKILIMSKVTMGLGLSLAVLITAGMSRVNIKKYIAINFFGGLIWVGFMVALGYYFGKIYLSIEQGLNSVFLGVMILAAILALFGFAGYMRERFNKNKL
jgi:membrane protein DedA with SNARE-associated domain